MYAFFLLLFCISVVSRAFAYAFKTVKEQSHEGIFSMFSTPAFLLHATTCSLLHVPFCREGESSFSLFLCESRAPFYANIHMHDYDIFEGGRKKAGDEGSIATFVRVEASHNLSEWVSQSVGPFTTYDSGDTCNIPWVKQAQNRLCILSLPVSFQVIIYFSPRLMSITNLAQSLSRFSCYLLSWTCFSSADLCANY